MNLTHGMGGVLGSRVVGHHYNSRAINVYTMVTLAFNQPYIQLNSEAPHHRLRLLVYMKHKSRCKTRTSKVTLSVPLISAMVEKADRSPSTTQTPPRHALTKLYCR